MSLENDSFLRDKSRKIDAALESGCVNMFELIGSVNDMFSSAYITKEVAEPDVVRLVWSSLINVFFFSNEYNNRFDSIVTMSEISRYAKKFNIILPFDELIKWRSKHDDSNSTSEILECLDDILI
ncbi:hypothetical protein [Kosakonia sp.]|uniref:hypothetical protein n=1 Tax=Kosakonia sp. TaxID=1916651 RepID=UPI00289AEA80|nr:hypothetical protein [Kosakonia sp.]